jgi:hypothetical protein
MPTITPVAFTVTIEVFDVLHVTTRPVKALPCASLGVAVNWRLVPTRRTGEGGETVTLATGVITVIDADPLMFSALAVMRAVPSASPLTSPEFTLAI